MTADLPTHAVALAERGFHVFPLVPGRKKPLTTNGFKAASDDPVKAAIRWTNTPCANIGLATGNGLVVIDIDPDRGGAFDPAWPETLLVGTAGGGWHLYYRCAEPVRNSVGRLASGVDVRGDGGYVVAPPSRDARGEWYWVDVAVPMAVAQADMFVPTEHRGSAAGTGRRFEPRDNVGEGERNDYLARYAGWLFRNGYDEDEVIEMLSLENQSACVPPVDAREVEQVARSIARYHT